MESKFDFAMEKLMELGKERQKKLYMGQGAREPLFGVPSGAMKQILKVTGKNQSLAEELYRTGNYDAMYLAGVVAEPDKMTAADFNRWMERAYCNMIGDFIVSVTLAEAPIAQDVADEWIKDEHEIYKSAGWCCYQWLLGSRKDSEFDRDKLLGMLGVVESSIHQQSHHIRRVMNDFIIALGASYLPLHDEAVEAAKRIGTVEIMQSKGVCDAPSAVDAIKAYEERGKLGFKRKNVRC